MLQSFDFMCMFFGIVDPIMMHRNVLKRAMRIIL